MAPPSQPAAYYPQLDGLRALAISGVLWGHFLPNPISDYGAVYGVRLFFVLSGFLITQILLRSRVAINDGRSTAVKELLFFYARRSLRIFPIYYGTLAVSWALNAEHIRDSIGWYASYTLNFHIAQTGRWPGVFSHFWSLCVEEQFYWAWPFLIVLGPFRRLPLLIVASCCLAPISRFLIAGSAHGSAVAMTVLPTCCLDFLAGGALLAWFFEKNRGPAQDYLRIFRRNGLLWAALFLPANAWLLATHPGGRVFLALRSSLVAAALGAVVAQASVGFGGPLGRLLGAAWLRYVGRISYGAYIYHNFMNYIGPPRIMLNLEGRLYSQRWDQFLWQTFLTFAAASLSCHLVERQFLNLKRYFAAPVPTTPAVA